MPQYDSAIPGTKTSPGATPSWMEAAEAQFAATSEADLSTSRGRAQSLGWDKLKEAVTLASGKDFNEALEPFYDDTPPAYRTDEHFWRAMDGLRETLPHMRRGQVWTKSQFAARNREEALERYHAGEDIAARAEGLSGASATFAGGVAASLTDPINIMSMMALRAPAGSILKAAGYEAAINAGTQTAIEPFVQDYRGDLGLEAGLAPALRNIAFAGAGGFVFGAGGRALEKGFAKMFGPASDEIAALQIVEDHDQFQSQAPFTSDLDGDDAHVAGALRAGAALAQDEPPPAAPVVALNRDLPVQPRPSADASLRMVRPEDVEIDAATFQFKSGGDDKGVTARLREITEWRPEPANITIGWERADGTLFMADGHQRHGLASRIKARDPAQDPQLAMFVYREADGFSAEMVTVAAALKNIAEGTGAPLDAAKVLRHSPEMARGLPEGEAFIKNARGLAALSDEAFDLAERGIISEIVGGAVGRAAADAPGVHVQMAQALEKLKPRGVSEADFMARDLAAAPVREETTADLFGETTVQSLLIKERAEIRQGAISRLAKDKRAFETLVRESEQIEALGNRLAGDANRARITKDVSLALQIEKTANRKGDIADALNAAATARRDGLSRQAAIDQFIKDVQSRSDGNGAGRGDAGGAGAGDRPAGRSDPEPQAAVRPARAPDPVEDAVARKTMGELAEEAPDQAAARLDLKAREFQERALAEGLDFDLIDPDTGQKIAAKDLFDEINGDDDALARLKGCVV